MSAGDAAAGVRDNGHMRRDFAELSPVELAGLLLSNEFWEELGYTVDTIYPAMVFNAQDIPVPVLRDSRLDVYANGAITGPVRLRIPGSALAALHGWLQHEIARIRDADGFTDVPAGTPIRLSRRAVRSALRAYLHEPQQTDPTADTAERERQQLRNAATIRRTFAAAEEAAISAAQSELHELIHASAFAQRQADDPDYRAAVQAAADAVQAASVTGGPRTVLQGGVDFSAVERRVSDHMAALANDQEERSTPRMPITAQTVISGIPAIDIEYATYDEFQQYVQAILQKMSAAQDRPDAPWMRAAGGSLMFVRGKIRSHIGRLATVLSQAFDTLPVPHDETIEDAQLRTGRGMRQVTVAAAPEPGNITTMRVTVAPLVIPVSLMGDAPADVLSAIVYALCDLLVAGGRPGVSDKQKAMAKAATRHIMDMLNRHRYVSTYGNPASLQNIRQCAYSIRTLREQLGLRDCHIVIPLTCCGYGESAREEAMTAAWNAIANWPPLRIFMEDSPNTLVVMGTRDAD